MLGFENLTFAPLARDLIDVKLLTKEERKYVNDYHKQVPLVTRQTQQRSL